MASAIEQLASGISLDTFRKASDLKKRIGFTLLALIVYRLGTYIPLPGINPDVIGEFVRSNAGGILGMLDMFSGGSVGRMTIFALNIMPYISASIMVQLLTSVIPQFEALKKEGESGRRKLNQYTRYGTVILACIQAYGISVGLEKLTSPAGLAAVVDPGLFFKLSTVITLTGGTLFVMWLGEQITSRGVGNGISLIIYSGIVANLPQAAFSTFELGRQGALSGLVILSVLVGLCFIFAYVVFMEKAQRRILIQYPKRQVSANMPAVAENTHLPLKLNSAGVIPPIFASSLLSIPMMLTAFSQSNEGWMLTLKHWFSHGHIVYATLFVSMIIFFAFFYTAIVFNPAETADNLRKSGSYIPGIRPGKQTADYLDWILTRLTAVGAIYLASVCVLPEFVWAQISLPFYLGGTSVLIVVSVTVETFSQIQSHLVAHQYEGLMKRAKLGKFAVKKK